jgi:hypothetical protein
MTTTAPAKPEPKRAKPAPGWEGFNLGLKGNQRSQLYPAELQTV